VRHIVVEANPALVEFCGRNASSGRPAGAPVTAIGAAIAYDVDGYAEFWPSDAFLGSHLARAGERGTIRVPAITLRQLLADHQVGEFDLVCDIEGAELELVRNDADVLSRCRLAIVEIHPDVFADKGSAPRTLAARL